MCLLEHIAPICPFSTALSNHFSEMSLHWTFPLLFLLQSIFQSVGSENDECTRPHLKPWPTWPRCWYMFAKCEADRPRKSWHGRRELQSFAQLANLFKTLYESRFSGIWLNIFSGPCRGNNNQHQLLSLMLWHFWGLLGCAWQPSPSCPSLLRFLAGLGGGCSRPDHLTYMLFGQWSKVRLLESGSTQRLKENVHKNNQSNVLCIGLHLY